MQGILILYHVFVRSQMFAKLIVFSTPTPTLLHRIRRPRVGYSGPQLLHKVCPITTDVRVYRMENVDLVGIQLQQIAQYPPHRIRQQHIASPQAPRGLGSHALTALAAPLPPQSSN